MYRNIPPLFFGAMLSACFIGGFYLFFSENFVDIGTSLLLYALAVVIQSVFYFCYFAPLTTKALERGWSRTKLYLYASIPFIALLFLNPLLPFWVLLLGYENEELLTYLAILFAAFLYSATFAEICVRTRLHQGL